MSLVTKAGLQRFFTGLKDKFAAKSHTHTKNQITDFPSSMPANGGNAATVNGHTVNSDVPSGAKFTDTNTWRPVQDSLTSTAADQSLSANQGKVLKGLIDGKAASNHTHDLSAMINTLSTGTSTPSDADYYVSQYVNGGTTTTTYHRRPMSALWSYIKDKADGVYQIKGNYAAASHTHNYAGSASAGGSATSAVKLDTATAGSATQPVYFSGGKPVATTYTLGKSVPADAVFTDTVYSHPTSSGNKHIPSGGSAGQFLKWSADGTAVWAADNNTTYNNATQSSAGLMSSTDKKKLDSVDMANACMYDGTSTDISEMQSTCDYIDGGAY